MTKRAKARIGITFNDAWLIAGVRTPFVDYNGALAHVSPIDLGIKVARDVLAQSATSPRDVGTVIAGSMAQASFDAYMLPRHIGLYAGVPIEVPAYQVQRVCGTGIEVIMQAADTVSLGRSELALCVGTESMSRNPVVAYTHRGGFRMGQVEFKDFLWEALIDPAPAMSMGDTAEKLAKEYQITRTEVDAYASRSFARALAAQANGFLAGEITPMKSESFAADGLNRRGIRLEGCRARGRHPCACFIGRGAGHAQARLWRRPDRRELLRHRRWRGGRAGRLGGLREAQPKAHSGAHPGRCRHRGPTRYHGHRSGAGDPRGA